MDNLLLFGGTFNPIHKGHLQVALNVQKKFKFGKVIFLPCKSPVLKCKPTISTEQRLAMLRLALSERPFQPFFVDEREIKRDQPSYMVTTLKSFREELGFKISITLLMGYDAFAQLSSWYEWRKILSLANILVVNRQNALPLKAEINAVLKLHETKNFDALKKHSFGYIYQFDAGNFDLSSTYIRENITLLDLSPLLPQPVMQYIKQFNLYQKF